MSDNCRKVIKLRLPIKNGADLLGCRDHCAGSPGRRGAFSTLKSTPETHLTVSMTSRTDKPWPYPQLSVKDGGSGTFLLGTNFIYRLMFLLLCVPQLDGGHNKHTLVAF